MKYSIHGFSQSRAFELGLTNDDLLILRWFVDFSNTEKMRTIIETDGVYYWVMYNKILEDLPILKVSKERIKKKHFNNLCNVGVLKHKHIKEGGSFSYYALGDNYLSLIDTDYKPKTTEGLGENDGGGRSKITEGLGENDRTKINLLNNQSINNNKERKKESTYDAIIDELVAEEVKSTIYEFIKMRKLIKKPLTDFALKKLLNKLNKLSLDPQTQIAILEKSIMNNWQDIYEPKVESKTAQKQSGSTVNDMQYFYDKYKAEEEQCN